MTITTDPAVTAWVEWNRARMGECLAHDAPAFQRAARRLSRAEAAMLAAEPTTARGARCHLLRALHLRRGGESDAAGWIEEGARIAAGGRAERWQRVEAQRYAGLDQVPAAVPLLLRALRMLARRQHGALVPLREALELMALHPLPDTDNRAALHHARLAWAFLATPRAVLGAP